MGRAHGRRTYPGQDADDQREADDRTGHRKLMLRRSPVRARVEQLLEVEPRRYEQPVLVPQSRQV